MECLSDTCVPLMFTPELCKRPKATWHYKVLNSHCCQMQNSRRGSAANFAHCWEKRMEKERALGGITKMQQQWVMSTITVLAL